MKKYYVTTPIYYINDNPHIGHVYTTMAADIIARYRKSMGREVMFLTGTDENAVKIERAAKEKGLTTQQFVDQLAVQWEDYFKKFGLSFDDFIRTTQPRHAAAVRKAIQQLYDQGDVYKGSYEGWYCVPCETYFLESDLVDGKCPDCGRPVEKISEENYFFKLTGYRDKLLKHYDENPDFVMPKARFNEVYSVIKEGLRDVSFTRTGVDWGIKAPFDEKHVVYVWADALINYITAAGFESSPENFKNIWPADVHLVGKDIIRFHCIIWPAMLMALGLPLPKHIFAHGWWTCNGKKMSKSLGNFVKPHIEVENLVAVSGCKEELAQDAFRYFLFRELPFGEDGDFSRTNFEGRYNSDLANDLGNLLNRSQQMLQKNFDGIVPDGKILPEASEKFEETMKVFTERMEEFRFGQALEAIWGFINTLNTLIEVKKPWELVKQGRKEELADLHYTLTDGIRAISALVNPFIFNTAKILANAIGLDTPPAIAGLALGQLKPGTVTNKADVMFPRIQKKQNQPAEKPAEPQKVESVQQDEELMAIEDFQKFKFRVAKILNAEKVEGADKLLKLTIDIGTEQRTIAAGIAKFYKPEDLIGKTIVVVANLKPAKLRGIISQGMLLAATDTETGNVFVLSPEGPVVPGSMVK
ncbi:MAG TPA: methionine--tRNA ligase [Caldisericia bacterium]|nr:MAG: Methionine--tRNA ligase [bacterium ADurb.Bin132]HNW31128.1 methionine--tRNA ligase [Caldisericia bacterium]HNY60843.1 methionine--tRNA ligase [Caldisericia bacterium]HOC79951.1 methionine--tRNA ligase [Caldisericia bacterium]HOG69884.1 methionine--tRNA ligase [Caldisericia bacterium]